MSATATKDDTINLFQLGVLVQVKIRFWSMRAMLTPQDYRKMGMNPDKLPADLVNLGRKLLVPKVESQEFGRIEALARFHVQKWSVPFGIGEAHFVPAPKIGEVEEELTRLRDRFTEKVDSFISRLDQLKKKMRDANPDFWDKCLKNVYPTDTDEIRGRFGFDWFFFKVSGVTTSAITSSKIEEEEDARRIRAEEMRSQIQKQAQDFVGDYVSAMRQQVMEFCELVKARLTGKKFGNEDESKKLTAKTIGAWKTYIDRFREMNIFGDDEVGKMLDDFYKNFVFGRTSAEDFASADFKQNMMESLSEIRQMASLEGERTSKFISRVKRKVVI